MISNPANWPADSKGALESYKAFTYEGGSKLYNFCPRDCGLSSDMRMNLIIPANNKEHAIEVLEKLVRFAIDCSDKEIADRKEYHYHASLTSNSELRRQFFENLLNNKDSWKVVEAPSNQVFKVGWAHNDTIM